MEDLRIKNNIKRENNRLKIIKFLNFFKINGLKILLFGVVILILFFPEFTGNIVGNWLNTLINSFLSKINF